MSNPARQCLSLDSGWLFHLGDINPPLPNTHIAAYMLNKAGYARGAAKPSWDDSDWRAVDLPHDWSIEGDFSGDNHIDAGFLPRGVAWYRRHFALDESDRGRHFFVTFDGVATHCTVFVNGHLLHRNFCGYTPFSIDITDVARFGDDDVNTIAIRVDATYAEGWWYEGAGIYRHVWLMKRQPVHFATDGVFVTSAVVDDRATLTIRTTIANGSDNPATFAITSSLDDLSLPTSATLAARSKIELVQMLEIDHPHLWSCADPHLYQLHSVVEVGGAVVDLLTTTFGIRAIRFDPARGLFLNDQPLKLKGTCNHQDHAGVGVAVPDSIHEFRIRRLKEMGCNAYRAAHHPPARELLDACDRLGMLVIDENRNFGSSPQHLEQLAAMVKRDRNHPCVIAWSICNEEAIQGTPTAAAIARTMTAEVEKLDPSRPTMAAVSGGILNDGGLADAMPVVGINYQLPVNDAFHAKKPGISIVAAETHCVLATRGTYATDPSRFVFADNDSETAPWGATARQTWRFVSQRPWLAGLFVWSGFDYRGEPTPHHWPCISSQFGQMDLCGLAKDGFYLHKAWFTRDVAGAEPFLHIAPHWNWEGREGQEMRVRVYTNCDEAELFCNGESLGRKSVDPIEMVAWVVPYRSGTMRAVGYRDGGAVEASVETTGPAIALGLEIHPSFGRPSHFPADGHFAIPVTVFATDAQGRRVPTAQPWTRFSLDGPARIIGVGSGDPTSHEPNRAGSVTLFRGMAQLIVQMADTPGTIALVANSPELASAYLNLHSVAPASRRLAVPPAVRKFYLTAWRMSPITADRPDVHAMVVEQDVNSWERVEPGWGQWKSGRGGWAIYRKTFTPPRAMQSRGGRIVFGGIAGAAEFYLDDAPVPAATTMSSGLGAIEVALPPSRSAEASVTISVLLRCDDGNGGLTGRIELLA